MVILQWERELGRPRSVVGSVRDICDLVSMLTSGIPVSYGTRLGKVAVYGMGGAKATGLSLPEIANVDSGDLSDYG